MPSPTSRTLRKDVAFRFGPIGFTVSLTGAVDGDGTGLHGLCTGTDAAPHSPSGLNQRVKCPVCEQESSSIYTFPRGRAVGDGYVIVPKEVLDEADKTGQGYRKTIEVSAHPAEQLAGAMPSGSSYYLTAAPGPQADAYATMAAYIRSHPEKALVARFAFMKTAYLYQVVATGTGALALRQLAFPDAVREAPVVEGTVSERNLKLLTAFADDMTTDFDPAAVFNDRMRIIDAWVQQQTPVQAAVVAGPAADAGPMEFGDALEAAVAAAKERRTAAAKKAAAPRKAAAKKATAAEPRKRAAKKPVALRAVG